MASKPKRKRGVAPGRGGGGPGGQPRFIATPAQRQTVMALVAAGIEHKIISAALKIPERTLQRHFVKELRDGHALVNAQVGGGIVAKALRGERPYDIYYTKARMGWREHQRIGFEDENGKPVSPANLFSVSIT